MQAQFHLSIPVRDLDTARAFYVDLLGCELGRVGPTRLDINFFGNHVVAHASPDEANQHVARFESDGASVSVRHFGAIVPLEEWERLASQLDGNVEFTMVPQTIRPGTVGEQRIMMMKDGCGNIVEFKSITPERVFARDQAGA
ncbi:MAG: VOC family protein [Pseudomonadota bacterium]